MRVFHGSSQEIKAVDVNGGMYFSSNLDDAKEFALRLDDCGNYAKESFIYAIDIDETIAVIIEDFDEFDNIDKEDPQDKCPALPLTGFNQEGVSLSDYAFPFFYV